MDSHSFNKLNAAALGTLTSILAALVLWTQIALQLAFLTTGLLFKRIASCIRYSDKSRQDSRSRPQFGGRRKPRPRSLQLYNGHRPIVTCMQGVIPVQFATPAAGGTFYDDPSIIVSRSAANSLSPLSPQFATLARTLEEQLGPLPNQWSMHLSSDKRIFFVHDESGEATWRDPRLYGLGVSPGVPNMEADSSRPHPSVSPAACRIIREAGEEALPMTPIPLLSQLQSNRISHWVDEMRARNAKLKVLRSRARMAKMQRHMQPLAI